MRPSAIESPVLPAAHPRTSTNPVISLLDLVLREVSSWFDTTLQAAQGRAGHAELIVFFAILAAGTVLRFWGLGEVGLHGDEKTMALPMMHLLTQGTPLMPSGMFYPRAIPQLYLMAGSVEIFGQSEWAMRVPSALCGVLLIALAYFVGRRFLTAPWNLAFAAAVAFLPDFIMSSQMARMYIFFITCVAAFLLFLFKWERTDRTGYLVGAVIVLGVGMTFHTLTIFSAPLLFYPGLVQGDRRKTLLGLVAFVLVAAGFLAMDAWIGSAYPDTVPVDGAEPLRKGAKAAAAIPHFTPLLLAAAAAAAAAIGAFVARGLANRRMAIVTAILFAAGVLAQILFSYHAAALILIAAVVVGQRGGALSRGRLILVALACAAIAVAQVLVLRANGVESLRLMVGAMTGRPSIWPYIVASHYSVLASVLLVAGVAISLWQFAHRQRVPDFVLFVVLGVWIPLVLIGVFKWWILPRYADGQALPLLIGALATGQWLFARISAALPARRDALVQWGAAAVVCVLMVNPLATARAVSSGYAINPDHKGAAEFMKTVQLAPDDIVIAEDPLQQVYYLGHVDYWLNAKNIAQQFVHDVNGEVRDFYTDTLLLGSGADLQAVLDQPGRGAIYVIGSGENQSDGRSTMRGYGIAEVLGSAQFTPVFVGRDRLTKVWKAPRPGRPVAAVEAPSANR